MSQTTKPAKRGRRTIARHGELRSPHPLAQIGKILAMPDVRKKAEDSGTDVETMTPAQLGTFTRQELDHWGAVIKTAHIVAD